mgnify:CR=1 FL=1
MNPFPPQPGEPVFDDAERAAIVAEWNRHLAEPRPKSLKDHGLLLIVAAVVVGAAGPAVAPALTGAARIVAGVFAVAGIGLRLFGDRGLRWSVARVDAALAFFRASGTGGDPADRRRHAVTLVLRSEYASGPGTSTVFEPAKVGAELGDALPYVRAVERVLRGEVGASPVFTSGR